MRRTRRTRPDRSRRRLIVESAMLAAATIVPLAVAFAVLFTRRRGRLSAYGDTAILELSVRDVFHHPVLLGPYSRYHWHHPGPLLFDWLAIPYRVLGSHAHALYQGTLLTAAIAIGVVAWITHRQAGPVLVGWAMVAVAAFVWAVGPEVVRRPWNPWITILPLLAVIALAWHAATGRLWAYPFAVAGGSFVVQSHVSYAGVTAAVLGTAAVLALVGARRTPRAWRRVGLVGAVSVAVLGVLWSPPIYQELRDHDGNLTQLRVFFTNTRPDHDLADGVHVTLQELGVLPAQLAARAAGASEEERPSPWYGGITLVALAAAIVVAAVRRCRAALHLAGIVAVAILASVWSVARIVGPIDTYLVLWIGVTGTAAWIALGAALTAPGDRVPVLRPNPIVLTVVLVPVLVLAAVNTRNAWNAPAPEWPGTDGVNALTRTVRPALGPPDAGPVLVRVRGSASWPMAAGVMVQLERRGYTTLVEPDEAWLLGERRARRPGTSVAATLTFADADAVPTLDPTREQLVGHEGTMYDVSVFLRS